MQTKNLRNFFWKTLEYYCFTNNYYFLGVDVCLLLSEFMTVEKAIVEWLNLLRAYKIPLPFELMEELITTWILDNQDVSIKLSNLSL